MREQVSLYYDPLVLSGFTANHESGVIVTDICDVMLVTDGVFFLNLFVEDVSTLKVIKHEVHSALTSSELVREDFCFSVDNCL